MFETEKGTLYLIPTVIAPQTSSSVIPAQVREIASILDYFLVENVRTARRYLSSLKIGRPIEELQFEVLDKKTNDQEVSRLMQAVVEGRNVGIISEAGCPGVADPGALAVKFAHQNNIRVVPLTGPSSILMALMASGFNGQSFAFHGYLPIEKKARAQAIKNLERQVKSQQQTQLFMDTPYRNNALFKDLLTYCSSSLKLCVAKNITGSDEEIKTFSIGQWKKNKIDLHKVPVIFVLGND
ncbi:SAM-dependent methyltransferase [Xanthovirga aplysinae]|uniref:SAM-dependent methyltransferase n=1 Tax=Xanthovirga aplysinae TaxID=2529853 RepID=UPI0012BD08FD|nr:SAM-dependent methyltransferase [Xanthovirga aplysinae]MTI31317.1 SAM-dependent methyltransferase [Xanthovirga aplysinae]